MRTLTSHPQGSQGGVRKAAIVVRANIFRDNNWTGGIMWRRRFSMAFGTPSGIVLRWLLLAQLFVPGVAETGAQQTAVPGSAMVEAARTFLATLDSAQKSKAVLPFNSEERFHWFYTPVSRKG